MVILFRKLIIKILNTNIFLKLLQFQKRKKFNKHKKMKKINIIKL